MNPRCEAAVTDAAAKLGRAITQGEMRGIEQKVRDTMKQLAIKDRAAFASMTPAQRLEETGKLLAEQLKHDAIKKAQRAELQILAEHKANLTLDVMVGKGHSAFGSIIRMFAFNADNRGNIQSLEKRAQTIAMGYSEQLRSLFDLGREGTLGGLFTNREGIDAVVRESLGENTGNAKARQAAQAIKTVTDSILDQVNALGGDIGKLKGWLPQKMDMFRVWGPTFVMEGGIPKRLDYFQRRDRWVNDAMQHIDRSKYPDLDGNLLDDVKMREFLNESYQTLVSDGASKNASMKEFASTIANRNRNHRVLHWKNADSYLAMMDKYGAGSLLDQINSHISSMSRDMVLMETFGPNSLHTLSKMMDRAVKIDSASGKYGLGEEQAKAQTIVRYFTGNSSNEESMAMRKFFRTLHNVNISTLLGSILSSQLADNGTAIATARVLNLSVKQWGLHKMGFYGSREMKGFAQSSGVAFDMALERTLEWADDMNSNGFWGKMAATTMKLSGSSFFTQMHRTAFATFVLDQIGQKTRQFDWNTLSAEDRALLEGKGFTETDWKILKLAEVDTSYGGTGLGSVQVGAVDLREVKNLLGTNSTQKAEAARREASLKLTGMAIEESEMAVLQPGMLAKVEMDRFLGGSSIGKALLQFKSFPWAYLRQHMMQRASMNDGLANKFLYNAQLIGMTSVLGGLGLWMNDIAQGREPSEINAKFGLKAMIKGGGLSFAGDILATDWEGRDPLESITGPTLGKMVTLGKMGQEVVQAGLGQDDTKVAKRFLDTAKAFTPMQNLLWTRGVLHNVILDDLNEYASPGYKARMRNLAEKNYKSNYWLGYQ
jgi:hypothetical protein